MNIIKAAAAAAFSSLSLLLLSLSPFAFGSDDGLWIHNNHFVARFRWLHIPSQQQSQSGPESLLRYVTICGSADVSAHVMRGRIYSDGLSYLPC